MASVKTEDKINFSKNIKHIYINAAWHHDIPERNFYVNMTL